MNDSVIVVGVVCALAALVVFICSPQSKTKIILTEEQRVLRSKLISTRTMLKDKLSARSKEREIIYNAEPQVILRSANESELENLGGLLLTDLRLPDELVSELRKKGTNIVKRTARKVQKNSSWDSDDLSNTYSEVVLGVAKSVKAKSESKQDSAVELAIIQKMFSDIHNNLSEDELNELLRSIPGSERVKPEDLRAIAAGAGGVVLLQAGGFATYVAASTVVGAISGVLGVTLPFVIYTGMSKAISIAIGPVGWVLLGAWGIHSIASPKYKRLAPAIVAIATVRSRLVAENEIEIYLIQAKLKEIEGQLSTL